jgi:hypothetical protein
MVLVPIRAQEASLRRHWSRGGVDCSQFARRALPTKNGNHVSRRFPLGLPGWGTPLAAAARSCRKMARPRWLVQMGKRSGSWGGFNVSKSDLSFTTGRAALAAGRGSAGRSVSLQRPGAQGKARTRCRMFESEQRNESSAQTLLAQSQFRILSLNFGLQKASSRLTVPRRHPLLVVASARVAWARQVVSDQRKLIAQLLGARQATAEAKKVLQTYESSLGHLEEHQRKLRDKFRHNRSGYNSN